MVDTTGTVSDSFGMEVFREEEGHQGTSVFQFMHRALGGKRHKIDSLISYFFSQLAPGISPPFILSLLSPHPTVVRGGRNTRPFDLSIALYLIPYDSRMSQQPRTTPPSTLIPSMSFLVFGNCPLPRGVSASSHDAEVGGMLDRPGGYAVFPYTSCLASDYTPYLNLRTYLFISMAPFLRRQVSDLPDAHPMVRVLRAHIGRLYFALLKKGLGEGCGQRGQCKYDHLPSRVPPYSLTQISIIKL